MKRGVTSWVASTAVVLAGAVAVYAGSGGNTAGTAAMANPGPEQKLKLALDWAAMLEKMENYNEAAAQYQRVLGMDQDNSVALHRLGIVCSRLSQFDQADHWFQKAIKVQPRSAAVWNDWGRSWYLRGNWSEAERKFRHALSYDSRYQLAVDNLGLALGQQHRYSEAFQIFRVSGLTEAQSHTNIAFILWSQGRIQEAKQACLLAQRLDPSFKKAQQLLAQLEPSQVRRTTSQLPRISQTSTRLQTSAAPATGTKESGTDSAVKQASFPVPSSGQNALAAADTDVCMKHTSKRSVYAFPDSSK